MKKETKEATMSGGSSGSFEAPMGFMSKREIYKIHNSKEYNKEEPKEEEFTEATTSSTSSSGQYDAPFGSGGKNPLKIDGPKSIVTRMKHLRKSNFPMYGGKGGSYVKVKEKCKKFPYCDEGDINALEFYENDELNEAVKNVSKKYGLPYKEVEKIVINEIKDIFIEYESFRTK